MASAASALPPPAARRLTALYGPENATAADSTPGAGRGYADGLGPSNHGAGRRVAPPAHESNGRPHEAGEGAALAGAMPIRSAAGRGKIAAMSEATFDFTRIAGQPAWQVRESGWAGRLLGTVAESEGAYQATHVRAELQAGAALARRHPRCRAPVAGVDCAEARPVARRRTILVLPCRPVPALGLRPWSGDAPAQGVLLNRTAHVCPVVGIVAAGRRVWAPQPACRAASP